jgi:hypothetical protein
MCIELLERGCMADARVRMHRPDVVALEEAKYVYQTVRVSSGCIALTVWNHYGTQNLHACDTV